MEAGIYYTRRPVLRALNTSSDLRCNTSVRTVPVFPFPTCEVGALTYLPVPSIRKLVWEPPDCLQGPWGPEGPNVGIPVPDYDLNEGGCASP